MQSSSCVSETAAGAGATSQALRRGDKRRAAALLLLRHSGMIDKVCRWRHGWEGRVFHDGRGHAGILAEASQYWRLAYWPAMPAFITPGKVRCLWKPCT